MRFDWRRLLLQVLASLAGGIGFLNLGRLTVPDVGAGPADLAVWAGIPALLAAAGGVGQAFLGKPSGDTAKPGSPGHREFCQSVYQLALACEWPRLKAVVDQWEKTNAPEPPK